MILLKRLVQEFLCERMTFNQLIAASDGKPDNSRMDRSRHVSSKSVRVTTIDENEAWTFSYKSQGHHSTTGNRHHGYVRFFKDNVRKNERASDIECMVDCDCPDYKYRWAYNNARAGAGITGNQSWNGNNGNAPKPTQQGGVGNLGEGLCKHLISLGKYLQTEVEPEHVPFSEPQVTTKPSPKPIQPSPVQKPVKPTIKVEPETPSDEEEPDPTMMAAPQPKQPKPVQPTNTYTDTRSGTDVGDEEESEDDGSLTENKRSNLYQMMDRFAKTHPQFDVPVYEDEKKPA